MNVLVTDKDKLEQTLEKRQQNTVLHIIMCDDVMVDDVRYLFRSLMTLQEEIKWR